jgi:hypothetical protein
MQEKIKKIEIKISTLEKEHVVVFFEPRKIKNLLTNRVLPLSEFLIAILKPAKFFLDADHTEDREL